MRVLISGGGIAGPTLAWFLAKAGSRVTVIEKSQPLLSHGQNVDLQGSALKVVEKMGLMDQVQKHNTTELGTRFVDAKGRPFASFPIKDSSVSLTSDFEILRGDLAKVLHGATKDHPNIKYLLGTTIAEVISNNDGSVKVRLSNGDVQEFDFLVAADGQWSKLRRQCFSAEDIEVVDKANYVAYWTVPRLPKDTDWWNIYISLHSRIISLRPDPHGTMRALFSCMPCTETQHEAWQEASKSNRRTQQDLLRHEFSDAGWETDRLLSAMDEAPDFYFHSLQQIQMKTWHNSRVVCLGDAAYAPTPLTGLGTSLAITGAYVLAGELSKLPGDEKNPFKALEAYENAFRPFVEESQKIPSFVPDIAHPETAWKRWLLQTFVWAFSKGVALFVAVPGLAERFAKKNKDDFPLPRYSKFEE